MDCTELNRVRKGGALKDERWRTTDGEGKKKSGEEGKHGEIQFTQQCAGIQSHNYSTRSFHCVSWDDESSKANFDSSLLKLLSASCVAGSEVREAEKEIWDGGKCSGTRDRKDRVADMKG